jgi:hypothetical protein
MRSPQPCSRPVSCCRLRNVGARACRLSSRWQPAVKLLPMPPALLRRPRRCSLPRAAMARTFIESAKRWLRRIAKSRRHAFTPPYTTRPRGIAVGSREASTSLCAYDWSFAAGLLETAVQIAAESRPVALIAYDHRYPSPLNEVRPISSDFGVAFVLVPEPTAHTIASLDLGFVPGPAAATLMIDPALERMRATVPAARSLPLLAALGRRTEQVVILDYGPRSHLRVAVAPC